MFLVPFSLNLRDESKGFLYLPQVKVMSDEKIEFLAKYKDWTCVKRLSIDSNTKPREIVYILGAIWASVEDSLGRYLTEAGIDQKLLDEQANKIAQELGKKVSSSFRGVEDDLAKEVAKIYVIRKAMELSKWPIEINTKKLLGLVRK